MNSSVKEKIFALVVIIALGVVFVPMLFTQNHTPSRKATQVNINANAPQWINAEPQRVATLEDYKISPKQEDKQAILKTTDSPDPSSNPQKQIDTTAPSQLLHPVKPTQTSIEKDKTEQTKKTKNVHVTKKLKNEAHTKITQKALVEPPTLGDFPLSMVQSEETRSYTDKVVSTPLEHKPIFDHAEQPQSNSSLPAKGWAIQMATFSQENRATQLKKQLEQDGYPTYTIELHQGNRKLTQVLVGPYLQKTQAQQLQQTLQKKYSLQSLLVANEASTANAA